MLLFYSGLFETATNIANSLKASGFQIAPKDLTWLISNFILKQITSQFCVVFSSEQPKGSGRWKGRQMGLKTEREPLNA